MPSVRDQILAVPVHLTQKVEDHVRLSAPGSSASETEGGEVYLEDGRVAIVQWAVTIQGAPEGAPSPVPAVDPEPTTTEG